MRRTSSSLESRRASTTSGSDLVDPSLVKESRAATRLYPGMHRQKAITNASETLAAAAQAALPRPSTALRSEAIKTVGSSTDYVNLSPLARDIDRNTTLFSQLGPLQKKPDSDPASEQDLSATHTLRQSSPARIEVSESVDLNQPLVPTEADRLLWELSNEPSVKSQWTLRKDSVEPLSLRPKGRISTWTGIAHYTISKDVSWIAGALDAPDGTESDDSTDSSDDSGQGSEDLDSSVEEEDAEIHKLDTSMIEGLWCCFCGMSCECELTLAWHLVGILHNPHEARIHGLRQDEAIRIARNAAATARRFAGESASLKKGRS